MIDYDVHSWRGVLDTTFKWFVTVGNNSFLRFLCFLLPIKLALDNNNTDHTLYFIVDYSFMLLMIFFSLDLAVIIGNGVLFIAVLMVGTAYCIIRSRYSLLYYWPSRIVVHVPWVCEWLLFILNCSSCPVSV